MTICSRDRLSFPGCKGRRVEAELSGPDFDCEELGLGRRELGVGLGLRNDRWLRAPDPWQGSPYTDEEIQLRIEKLRKEVDDTLSSLDPVVERLKDLRAARG